MPKKTSRPTGASRRRSPGRPAPRRSPAALVRALVEFERLARRERVRWYLFGAQAVALHGVPRTTNDIDITIDLRDRTLSSFAGRLREHGFRPAIEDLAFAAAARIYPVLHEATGWKIDLVLAGPGIEQEFFDRVVVRRVGATRLPVLSVEHLIATKVLAGRPRDLEDVRGILRIAVVNPVLVRRTLGALEESLGQSDLVPLFEQLRSESRPRRS